MNIQSVNSFLSKKAESLKSIKANVTVDGRGLLPRFFYRGQSNDFKSSNNVASIFRQKELSGYTHEYSFTKNVFRIFSRVFAGRL
ncbi:FRG domain-containing protein, partial [Lactiplantibacillus plantarum]